MERSKRCRLQESKMAGSSEFIHKSTDPGLLFPSPSFNFLPFFCARYRRNCALVKTFGSTSATSGMEEGAEPPPVIIYRFFYIYLSGHYLVAGPRGWRTIFTASNGPAGPPDPAGCGQNRS